MLLNICNLFKYEHTHTYAHICIHKHTPYVYIIVTDRSKTLILNIVTQRKGVKPNYNIIQFAL